MDSLLQTLASLDAWVVYGLLGLLVFGESAAVIAILFPGELALLLAGAFIARGHASLPMVLAVAVVAAVAGHAASYELGRRYGLRALSWPLLRRHAGVLDQASSLVVRYGALAVLLGRWTNVGRIVVPLLVGAGRMPYRAFAVYNVLGGVAWVSAFVALGMAAGLSLDAVQRTVGHVSWSLTSAVAVGLALAWAWRRARRRRTRNAACVDVEGGGVRGPVGAASSSRSDEVR